MIFQGQSLMSLECCKLVTLKEIPVKPFETGWSFRVIFPNLRSHEGVKENILTFYLEIIARSYIVTVDKILVFSMVILYWCLLEDGCALKDSSWLNFPGLVAYDPVSYKKCRNIKQFKEQANKYCAK